MALQLGWPALAWLAPARHTHPPHTHLPQGSKLLLLFRRIRNNPHLNATLRGAATDVISYFSETSLVKAQHRRALAKETPFKALYRRLATSPAPGSSLYEALPWTYDDSVPLKRSRSTTLKKGVKSAEGPVVYWMQRDQRVADNWALVHAQRRAMKKSAPLVVVFALAPVFLGATSRQYGFMLRGLKQVEADLARLHIPFRLLLGDPPAMLPTYVAAIGASALVTDFSPLRTSRAWKESVAEALPPQVLFEEVDAHNLVPVSSASNKPETAARTIRRKLHNALLEFCGDFPAVQPHTAHPLPLEAEAEVPRAVVSGATDLPSAAAVREGGSAAAQSIPAVPPPGTTVTPGLAPWLTTPTPDGGEALQAEGGAPPPPACVTGRVDWAAAAAALRIDWSVPEVTWALPGERAAADALSRFLADKLAAYAEHCGDPNRPSARSCLSPYLHFGQLSAQRVVLETLAVAGGGRNREEAISALFRLKVAERTTGAQVFLDELVVQREVAENFVHYNPSTYDSFEGFPTWAQKSLNLHRSDVREHVYSLQAFEVGDTHEDLWNAAQMELVHTGKLHGHLRMYWAKKILEWTPSPEEALRIAIYLNDRYSLDGRDPNGYVGCAWAIGGVHDQGWRERPIFGKVRYMNRSGATSKFSVSAYVQQHGPVRSLTFAHLALPPDERCPPPAVLSESATLGLGALPEEEAAVRERGTGVKPDRKSRKRRLTPKDGSDSDSGEDVAGAVQAAAAAAGRVTLKLRQSASTALDETDDEDDEAPAPAQAGSGGGVRLSLKVRKTS